MANLARRGGGSSGKDIPTPEAKAKVLSAIQDGLKVDEACAMVRRSPETYRDWMKKDPEFKAAVQSIRAVRASTDAGRVEVPDFETFCAEWLDQPLFPHQLRILDVIEGREPRDMHDSMTFDPGYSNRVIINVPPEHAKSTTFTVNYVVWRIHKDPSVRVIIMSKGNTLAKDFLYEIKQKLTSSQYREMHMRFAPEGGWKDPDGSWAADRIYVQGKEDTDRGVQKDPTVQTIGLKGTIYGRRADLIILDDIVDTKNAREIDFQKRLINRDIDSRLPSEEEGGGLLLVLGTRVAPMDIYRTLLDEKDGDDRRVWTYFRQPAVLDYGDGDSRNWETLWPKKWPGPSLSRRRRDSGWNLIYQQLDVDDDMTFRAEAVHAAVNMGRFPGPMSGEGVTHRPGGMAGLYIVGGLDPASTGATAMIVSGLDKDTGKRWILDGFNQPHCAPALRNETMRRFTETYGIHEWVIETNAFQKSIILDQDLMNWFRARGCKMGGHYTTADKYDSDFGVPTMAPLFDSCVEYDEARKVWKRVEKPERRLMDLPALRQNKWVNSLVDQLTIWQPEGMSQKSKTDLVMAMWFTHIAHQRVLNKKRAKKTHYDSPFATPNARKARSVIDLAALRRARQEEREAAG